MTSITMTPPWSRMSTTNQFNLIVQRFPKCLPGIRRFLPSLATNNTTSDGLVDAVPPQYQDLYTKGCDEDRFLASSLAIPRNRDPVAIVMMFNHGRALISRIEEMHLNDPRRKERGFKNSGTIRPVTQVFSTGSIMLGDPYMVIIPFYVSGNVRLGEETVAMNKYYHVFGFAKLLVDEGAKLGAWTYALGT